MRTHVEADTFTESYLKLLQELKDNGNMKQSDSENPTAQNDTLELQGVTTEIHDPRTRVITEPRRDFSVDYLANELAWYMSGAYDVEGIERIENVWEPYTDENGEVRSNYGAKLFHEETRDVNGNKKTQWEQLNDLFEKDPETRRGIAHINLYGEDTPYQVDGKDFPCNVNFQLLKNEDDELDMHITQRSTDLVHGYGNDIPIFSFFQEMFATNLGYDMGDVIHHSGSTHIYRDDFDKLPGTGHETHAEVERYFPEMQQEDVDALLEQNYEIDTPFMGKMREHLDDYWRD